MALSVVRCDAAICLMLGVKRKSFALARNDMNDRVQKSQIAPVWLPNRLRFC